MLERNRSSEREHKYMEGKREEGCCKIESIGCLLFVCLMVRGCATFVDERFTNLGEIEVRNDHGFNPPFSPF